MQRGQASAEEAHQVTNLERIVCVYDLMMKRTVEQVGEWTPGNGAGADPGVNGLIERVQATAGGNAATIRDALTAAAQQANLICEQDHGRIRWRWRNYL